MDELLGNLAKRLRILDADTISFDEIAHWPEGKLDELVKAGVLSEIRHSKGVICNECEENCFIEPNLRTHPDTSKTTGVFVCTRNPDIGRINIDLDRLRQWEISKDSLKKLGFYIETGPEPQDEFITVQEAATIFGISRGSISRLATGGKIKHNGETGDKRRVSKLSVLIYKNNRETKDAKRDFDDYQSDAGKIPDMH